MIMNSNVVYGASVCHNGSATSDYQNYHHPDLAYYQASNELSASTTGIIAGAAPATSHYASTLHMSTQHQFGEGIINETNGLSYTNLDTQPNYATNPVPPHHQRLSHYSDARTGSVVAQGPPLGPNVAQGPPQLSVTQTHQSYPHQYRDFSHSDGGQLSSGQDMISALSDCAVRTGITGGPTPTPQYPTYLDAGLLTRRNGSAAHHQTGLHSGHYTDATQFADMTCSQLNGGAYHLNHLTSHLHHSPHHHHHHHHHPTTRHGPSQANSVIAAAPVPQYKWMQVKRNIPKPNREFIFIFNFVLISYNIRHSYPSYQYLLNYNEMQCYRDYVVLRSTVALN